jgi:hypothetical protein
LATTYVWQFDSLDVYPTYGYLADAVYAVHWRMLADDGAGHAAQAYGVQQCGPIDPAEFIPYPDLTFYEVRGWVEAGMGSDLVSLKLYLDSLISIQVNPPTMELSPPWA